jgi:hypothetical protein
MFETGLQLLHFDIQIDEEFLAALNNKSAKRIVEMAKSSGE